MNTPCFNCKNRTPGCNCEAFRRFREQPRTHNQWKYDEAEQYLIQSTLNHHGRHEGVLKAYRMKSEKKREGL